MTLLGVLIVATACQQSSSSANAPVKTADQKGSYALGMNIGKQLKPAAKRLDRPAFERGLEDALAGRKPALPEDSLQGILAAFSSNVQKDRMTEMAAEGQKNLKAGKAYMEQNAKKPGVKTTKDGLQYQVLTEGKGPHPDSTDQVTINYKGTLIDGKEFDSSYKRGKPATFGVDHVIKGFSEGLQLMRVGSKYRFVIPPNLAYGSRGTGSAIGPDETLIFEVELLKIDSASAKK